MAETITFKGTTIWDAASNGLGWEFTAGAGGTQTTEVGAPLGTGYWLKQGNGMIADHSLRLEWRTTSKSTLRSTILGLATHTTGSLVMPDWGTFTNCRLVGGISFTSRKGPGSEYYMTATLTFRQYP